MTSVEFLHALQPRGPWALAAIDPDLPPRHADKIKCRCVGTDELAVARFIRRHGDRNLYYQLNRVVPNLGTRRAKKRQISECIGLHCEIDPPVGLDLAAWQRDKRAELLAWSRMDIPRPSIAVFSGSGFQLIWLLDEPTVDIEAVEARNRALIDRLGGDAGTWNADHLLRLPGTLNYPGERKRLKYGRTGSVLAEVMS